MKRTYLLFAAMLVLVSCNNRLDEPVTFDAQIADTTLLTVNDDGLYQVPVGTTLTFLFTGNADFISLLQEVFNETSATLNFDTRVSWNDNDDNLQLFLSTTFEGLNGVDAHADSTRIASHEWTNLSAQCLWPDGRNDEQHSAVDLTAYRGQDITLAFRYKTYSNDAFQPMFTISNLKINNTVIKTGLPVDSIMANNMGLRVFDMCNLVPDSVAYQSGSSQGIWDLDDYSSIVIRQTTKGKPLNEDWLITKPLTLLTGKTTTLSPQAIKNFYLNVDSYAYTFEETGIYTLTFRASNANYRHQSSTQRVFTFAVVESVAS